jgi:hypothetical protein
LNATPTAKSRTASGKNIPKGICRHMRGAKSKRDGQFARHTRDMMNAHYEFSMKVFNSSVENRVEKRRRRNKLPARTRLFPLCTILVQLVGP